jgi:hypothetical protein
MRLPPNSASRQRSEITRGADGALRGNDGEHVLVEHGQQQTNDLGLHTRGSLRQACGLEAQHKAYDWGGQGVTHASTMRAHDVDLKFLKFFSRNADARQLAEASVDTVNRIVAPCGPQQDLMAFADDRPEGWIKPQARAAMHLAPETEAGFSWGQQQTLHAHPSP